MPKKPRKRIPLKQRDPSWPLRHALRSGKWCCQRGCFQCGLVQEGQLMSEKFATKFNYTQIVKCMWWLRDKGSRLKDAKKAQFYLGRLIEKLS